ncbi:MAG: LysR family transcriptional regulator [Legionellaceae bacterium]|nr:LysR family transcriptional regulator [Legionellaceae bacterium]|tara:strand:+ start:1141 stop:2049 length:909 start_codon:yes stop_codon:yes gene_type:complete
MTSRITLNQLRILAAVAETGSVTKASTAVFLTQPAVSTSMKLLEEHFGTALLEIINKKAHLTQAGQAVYEAHRHIKEELEMLEQTIADIKGCLQGVLNIAMVSTAKFFVPHIVGEFMKEHPKIETKQKILNRHDVLFALQNNHCDFAIMSQLPGNIPFITHRIAENPLVMIASPENPLCKKQRIEVKDLVEEKCIVREQGSGIRQSIEALFSKKNLVPTIAMELSSTEAIKQMVIANIGIGIVPKLSLKTELELGKLKILNVVGTPITEHWHVVYLKNKKLPPLVKKFIEYLLTHNEAYTAC